MPLKFRADKGRLLSNCLRSHRGISPLKQLHPQRLLLPPQLADDLLCPTPHPPPPDSTAAQARCGSGGQLPGRNPAAQREGPLGVQARSGHKGHWQTGICVPILLSLSSVVGVCARTVSHGWAVEMAHLCVCLSVGCWLSIPVWFF